ncbi:MAG: VWA domain-containing protein [Rhodospirillales bacterium]|nr:VWA domain-containing protein [Rhodospirillales bacterium]
MTADKKLPRAASTKQDVDAFLRKVAAAPVNRAAGQRGRLLFAMDATASRQPSWDQAAEIQAEMFTATAALGGLEIQLAFYRGFGEFRVSKWTASAEDLLRLMTSVFCLAGHTQIGKVLSHAENETKQQKVNAVVLVGDCVEEDVDRLGALAGELGLLGVPVFMFHEGTDPAAAFAFQQVARLSGGAYCRFDANSPDVLKSLLSAVAVYAAGGRPALENFARKQGGEILLIAHQMKGG